MVAIRLRQMRRLRRLTQEELADRAGVSQSQISAWEGGRRNPDIESVRKLARAFEMSHEELARQIGYIDPAPGNETVTDIFDRAPLQLLDAELRRLRTAPDFPDADEQLAKLDALSPAAKSMMIRRLARAFLWRLREEFEEMERGDT